MLMSAKININILSLYKH